MMWHNCLPCKLFIILSCFWPLAVTTAVVFWLVYMMCALYIFACKKDKINELNWITLHAKVKTVLGTKSSSHALKLSKINSTKEKHAFHMEKRSTTNPPVSLTSDPSIREIKIYLIIWEVKFVSDIEKSILCYKFIIFNWREFSNSTYDCYIRAVSHQSIFNNFGKNYNWKYVTMF